MKRKIIRASLSAIIAYAVVTVPASALIRPVVEQRLDQARKHFNAGDLKGAATWVDKASAVLHKTPEELEVISQFRRAIKERANPHRAPRA
jgi:hypothetical protein